MERIKKTKSWYFPDTHEVMILVTTPIQNILRWIWIYLHNFTDWTEQVPAAPVVPFVTVVSVQGPINQETILSSPIVRSPFSPVSVIHWRSMRFPYPHTFNGPIRGTQPNNVTLKIEIIDINMYMYTWVLMVLMIFIHTERDYLTVTYVSRWIMFITYNYFCALSWQ